MPRGARAQRPSRSWCTPRCSSPALGRELHPAAGPSKSCRQEERGLRLERGDDISPPSIPNGLIMLNSLAKRASGLAGGSLIKAFFASTPSNFHFATLQRTKSKLQDPHEEAHEPQVRHGTTWPMRRPPSRPFLPPAAIEASGLAIGRPCGRSGTVTSERSGGSGAPASRP